MSEASTILIDPDAAQSDISKLKAAIQKLEASQSSITKLNTNASEMSGQTGTAITEKCSELSKQITNLKSDLEYTIRLINAAVKEYNEKDTSIKNAILKGGV